jgi:hypothetical protein
MAHCSKLGRSDLRSNAAGHPALHHVLRGVAGHSERQPAASHGPSDCQIATTASPTSPLGLAPAYSVRDFGLRIIRLGACRWAAGGIARQRCAFARRPQRRASCSAQDLPCVSALEGPSVYGVRAVFRRCPRPHKPCAPKADGPRPRPFGLITPILRAPTTRRRACANIDCHAHSSPVRGLHVAGWAEPRGCARAPVRGRARAPRAAPHTMYAARLGRWSI